MCWRVFARVSALCAHGTRHYSRYLLGVLVCVCAEKMHAALQSADVKAHRNHGRAEKCAFEGADCKTTLEVVGRVGSAVDAELS